MKDLFALLICDSERTRALLSLCCTVNLDTEKKTDRKTKNNKNKNAGTGHVRRRDCPAGVRHI